jgi:hypothetical protein
MNTTSLLIVAATVVLIALYLPIDMRARARERRARENWHKAREKLKRWLATPYHTIDSPQGQWYLRAEIGAYMLYLDAKYVVLADDKSYLERQTNLVDPDCIMQEPYDG